ALHDVNADHRFGLGGPAAEVEIERDARRHEQDADAAGEQAQVPAPKPGGDFRITHWRLRRPLRCTALRETMAMSCARIQSIEWAGSPIIARSALGKARPGWPCRL